MVGGICVDCLVDSWNSIIEISPMIAPEPDRDEIESSIKFVDLRGSDVEYNFAFFNIRIHRFISMSDRVAWYSFVDFSESVWDENIDMCCNPRPVINSYAKLCPEWVFD